MASPLCKTGRVVGRLAGRAGSQQAVLPSPASQGGRQEEGGRGAGRASLGLGLLGVGAIALAPPLLADEKKDKKIFGKSQADRIRQYATADNVFDHFASYQLMSDAGIAT
jgi:hypothetical protein